MGDMDGGNEEEVVYMDRLVVYLGDTFFKVSLLQLRFYNTLLTNIFRPDFLDGYLYI